MNAVANPPPKNVDWGTGQRIALAAGPLVLVASLIVAPPDPITHIGFARVGLLAFAVIWWIGAPLPLSVTTLAALGLGSATGSLTLAEAFANPSSWVLWFTVGAFGIGAALEATGFNRRFALAFLDQPWVRGRPLRFLAMFLTSAAVMSALMANTVVSVVWLSLGITIYHVLQVDKSDSFAETNTLGIAWAANIGGVATPVGTATNPVAIGMIGAATGVTITFLQWTILGSLLAVIFIVTAVGVLRFVVRPDGRAFQRPETAGFVSTERRKLGPMPAGERLAVSYLGVAVLLWFIPDIARFVAPENVASALAGRLSLVVPALLIPSAMCLTPVRGDANRRFVLTWEEWARGVDWGMVLFIGGVMAIGGAVGAESTGVPAFMKAVLEPYLGGLSEYVFVLVLTTSLIMVTSIISNLVSLAVFLPLGLTLSQALAIGDPVAVGFVLGVAPSLAYVLPSGTTTNAIVAGSGYLRVSTMLRSGLVLVIVHGILLAFVGYPLAKLILP